MKNLLSTVTLLAIASMTQAGQLEFQKAHIPESPPGVAVMAAYFTIVNNSDTDRSIDNISSTAFEKIEIHQTIIENNVARMEKINKLVIPANESVKLKVGNIHLMLITPVKNFVANDLITLKITESDETEHILAIPVQKKSTQHDHHHHTDH